MHICNSRPRPYRFLEAYIELLMNKWIDIRSRQVEDRRKKRVRFKHCPILTHCKMSILTCQ